MEQGETMDKEKSTEGQRLPPIEETKNSVSYLGVGLPKATGENGQFVPKREQYSDFINDSFSLELQKNIAVSFHQGDPILIEGGTSIGKTTAIRKMASELNWEVHYVNLNGATDVEDLMGRYIPNPNKKNATDPEYLFADGKVTSGLRQEEGKIKIILLDEFNSAAPNILIRLHEVVDALNRGENVVLSEDASEAVATDKTKTKIVGLMNPPGKGYFGREPLDPAQLRRWVYFKAPSTLPKEAFTHATSALFSLEPQMVGLPEEAFLSSPDSALLPEQLKEIPGMEQILAKYQEFHEGAKKHIQERKIGQDQPQIFTFDDRMEPKRVRDFVLNFYNGDINETFKTALRYYYSNKVESAEDKAKLEEMINLVEYTPPQGESKRRGLKKTEEEPETKGEGPKDEVEAWVKVLGKEVSTQPLPDYITDEVKANLEKLGMELRFIPKLDLSESELKTKEAEKYLKELAKTYPNWQPKESFNDTQLEDWTVPRNLEQWFWGEVKDGDIDFPELPGQWIAVETLPKPTFGDKYNDSPITEMLGFSERFNTSWDDIDKAIKKNEADILKEIGVTSKNAKVRLLEPLEWNLVANREGWGQTNTYEWTNAEYRGDGGVARVVVGHSDGGGAGYAGWGAPSGSGDGIGFRLAVVLGS
jgi:hypothetical protein